MLKRYLKDTGGNFAMMFGLVSTFLLLGVGAAIDYNGMRTTRSHMQNYADAAVLAAAGSGKEDKAELLKIAKDTIAANNFDGKSYNVSVKTSKKGYISVDVTSNYTMAIMGIFGKSNTDVRASAEAPLASEEPVDIALVLDITGSMSGAKITALKTAANGLIDQLEAFESDSVRVAVIPFRDYVNVGLSRRNEPWLDVDDDSSTTGAEVCYMRTPRSYVSGSCETYTTTCDNDGVSYSCTKTRNCQYTYGEPYEYCYTPTTTKTWRGCVGSRSTPWNERAHKGAVDIPGLMNISCGEEIQELTSDMTAVRSKIDSLSAYGKTYLPSGLMWGWRSLHPEKPLVEASSVDKKNKATVLIFMTDGANTRSQNGEYHNGSDIDDANDLSKELCNGINADYIDIYTVAYDFDAADTLLMLEQCATKKSMFYKADDSDSLIAAFKEIGENLFSLRLSN
jgi:Flp pilus assembly protein TadG